MVRAVVVGPDAFGEFQGGRITARRGRPDPGEVDALVADVLSVLHEFRSGERWGRDGRNGPDVGRSERPEVFSHPRFGLGGVEIADDGDGDLVWCVVLGVEGADDVDGNGAEILDGS